MSESKVRAAQRATMGLQQQQKEEYGRLELLKPVPLEGGAEGHEVVIYRPFCRGMTEVLDTSKLVTQVERFVDACCYAFNGSGEPMKFHGRDLSSVDASELAGVIAEMTQDADTIQVSEEQNGDGVTQPMIYTLQRPVKLITTNSDNNEVVQQISFEARKLSEISEFLDARGETREFHTFMRLFGKPLDLRIPVMSDYIINALDFIDYMVIRRTILPKFIVSRNRWKKQSSTALSSTIGPPTPGAS